MFKRIAFSNNKFQENSVKIGFERKIALVSNAPYVHHTDFLFVTNKLAPFQLRVDATGLEKGKVYFTEVRIFVNLLIIILFLGGRV